LENGKLIRLPLGRIRAQPICIVACGPRPQCRLGPCAQRAWPMACRAGLSLGHRSPGVRRGGGATMAEVEQKTALEHPRRRGYPPGMGVEAIAHRSSLSTGRGKKTGSAAAFSDEARAPVAGGGPASGWREREVGSTLHGRKVARGGSGPSHRGRARDGGGGRTTMVARSDSVGRLWTRTTARSGRRTRGKATAWTAGARTEGLLGRLHADRRA
jgi:hypothetical protein